MDKLDKKQIQQLLPHREPMLLIDELYDIKKLTSATNINTVNAMIKWPTVYTIVLNIEPLLF